jgi:hypothetical protein
LHTLCDRDLAKPAQKGQETDKAQLHLAPDAEATLRNPDMFAFVRRVSRSVCTVTLRRPSCLPWALALASPARIHSWIIARSYSAKHAQHWNIALPLGVYQGPADGGTD